MGEREPRDTAATARSQSVVHFIERDYDVAAGLVASVLDRAATAEGGPAVLVIFPALDDALDLSEALRTHRRGEARALAPITSAARGRRVLAAGATAVAGAPSELVRLIGESRLSLSGLHMLVLVWPEETLADEQQRQALDSVIAEVPRSAERVAICSARSTELAAFLERAMWRARTVDHATTAALEAPALRVVTVVPAERARALRTLLDAYDPESTVLVTFSDAAETAAHDAAAVLGSGAGLVQVHRGVPEERFSLVVIFDDIPSAEDLTAISATTGDLVALVRPSRLAKLRKLATLTPVTWSGALASARSSHDALRDEIRGTTGSGTHLSWVPIVEPLLEGVDAVEVAAAAMMLLDRERRKAKRAATVQAAAAPAAERPVREERPRGFGDRPSAGRFERGERGERRERDFGRKPAGGDKFGRRPRDEDPRRGPPRDRGERPRRDDSGARREGRGRDDAGAKREGRGGRGDFGAKREGRGSRDDRGPRRPRSDDIERFPRAAREGREWAERGERLRHSRRGPRRERGEGGE